MEFLHMVLPWPNIVSTFAFKNKNLKEGVMGGIDFIMWIALITLFDAAIHIYVLETWEVIAFMEVRGVAGGLHPFLVSCTTASAQHLTPWVFYTSLKQKFLVASKCNTSVTRSRPREADLQCICINFVYSLQMS